MTVFSLTVKPAPEAPVQTLKEVWGPVTAGEEPWRGVLVKSRVMPGTSLAYDRAKGETVIISLNRGSWDLRVVTGEPHQVEEALRRGTALPHSGKVIYHGADAVDASGAFVRWCLS